MDPDFLEDLNIKIMLYTRVEIALQTLKNARYDLDDAIRSKNGREIGIGKASIVMLVDRYLSSLYDYNNYISGKVHKDAVKKYFINEIDATSKLIQCLKDSM